MTAPETAVLAGFSAPLGNPNFGSRQVGAGATLAYSWELSECLSVGGNTGGFFGADGDDYFSQFSQSAAVGVSLTDRVRYRTSAVWPPSPSPRPRPLSCATGFGARWVGPESGSTSTRSSAGAVVTALLTWTRPR